MQELTAAIERGDVIVCLAKCDECQVGYHYDVPTWHGWAGAEDIYCAKTEDLGSPAEYRRADPGEVPRSSGVCANFQPSDHST
jgi:hypothetical protein